MKPVHFFRLLLTAALLSLASCQNGKFKPGSVKTAAISEVKMPKRMTLDTPISGGAILGAVALGAAMGATGSYSSTSAYNMGAAMGSASAQNGVQNVALENFFKAELSKKLKQKINATGQFQIVDDSNAAEADIRLTVIRWGFGKPLNMNPVKVLSQKVIPTCHVVAEMKTPEGKVLWGAFALDNQPGSLKVQGNQRSLDEYQRNPALVQIELSNVADLVTEKLAQTLSGPTMKH